MEKNCFMPDQRLCTEKCKAYRVDGECIFMELTDIVTKSLGWLLMLRTKPVYPQSAPPPKVNT